MTRGKILVADDDPLIRRLFERALASRGYEVLLAADGAEALDRFRRERPAIVVTDVYMPGMDGLELLTVLRREFPDAAVVITTGYGTEEIAIRAIRLGARNYFKKPVDLPDFLYSIDVLAEVVSRQREEQAEARAVAEEKTVILGNDLEARHAVVRSLTATAAGVGHDAEALRTGLHEMITNAIEHGNLGITREEKRLALHRGNYPALIEERRALPPYRERKVQIRSFINDREARFTIADEGRGFPWREAFGSDVDLAGLRDENGRGILLTRLLMDEVTYSAQGNEVTIVKRRPA